MIKKFLVMVLFIYGASVKAQDCKDIESLAGKLSIYANGKITIDGQQLEMKTDKTGRETTTVATQLKLGDIGPAVTGIYRYSVTSRNSANLPTEIIASNEGSVHQYSGFSGPMIKLNQKIILEPSKDGTCLLKRTVLNSAVTYDRELCVKLSELFDAFSKTEIQKCNQIVSKMANTVDNFKKSVKSEGLGLSDTLGKNTYQEAMAQSAQCAKILNGDTTNDGAISVPKERNKTKAVQ